jgi:hypothetical protein
MGEYTLSLPFPSQQNSDGKWILMFYHDPAHGWLMMPREMLRKYNISVSSFSPRNTKWMFCEEDDDAPKVLNALQKKKVEYEVKHIDLGTFDNLIRVLQ